MALRLAALVLGLAGLWLMLRWFAKASPAAVKKALVLGGLGLLVVTGIALVVSGKLGGLVAVGAGLSPWIARAMRLHGIWQSVRHHLAKRKPPPDDDRDGGAVS